MIEVEGLVKKFGHLSAVDGVSFNVPRGEVLGFLGPNGAGKSTTMKMITGFMTPTAGSVRVVGYDVDEHPIAAKAQIGYLPEGAPAYPDMTPISFLNFIADIRGMDSTTRRRRLEYVIANVHLEEVLEQPIDTLSKGFKRRVGLAQAILHDPPVLILDEPTDGLDPNQKHEVRGLIADMAAEKAIVISTHILEEVEAVCSRAMIIADGRIVADGTPGELEQQSPLYNAVLIDSQNDGVAEALSSLAKVARVEELSGGRFRAYPADGQSIVAEIADLVRLQGWSTSRLSVEPPRLDEVFRNITRPDTTTTGDNHGGAA
ncbi:MAG: ABC transporter ATP-binding protein [Rhodospirillaceae bacterium]|nr:ABC transporter ATP-binding protein [Rhodospirillaceae bacterium]MBT5898566.1 ABC transporter ATP-binding protein [Rhodospirillaceae bacterium]MBT6427753.1 ABC transporter ATP-binding protein [Rhodospirillaceae bacterium]MBT7760666.1 ABC transporter ATP-binding protein [Rhodospirillaceae bacterium]